MFFVYVVTYAPTGPSPSTTVSYANSTTIGTTTALSQSFMSGDAYSTTLAYGVNIPFVGGGSITSQWSTSSSQTTNNTSTVTTTFQTSSSEQTFGTGSYWAPVDNDYDTMYVWLNPA